MSLLRRIEGARPSTEAPEADPTASFSAVAPSRIPQVPGREPLRDAKMRIQNRVVSDLDPRLALTNQVEVRRQIEEMFNRIVEEEGLAPPRAAPGRLLAQLHAES